MKFSTEAIEAATATARVFNGRDIASLDAHALVSAQAAVAQARRGVEVLMSALAAETARRSAPELRGGLAKDQGFRSPQQMIANVTGGSLADARRLMEAGGALLEPEEIVVSNASAEAGEASAVPTPTPSALRDAYSAAEVSMEAAALIRETLRQLEPDADAEAVADVEARLVAKARRLSLAELRIVCERERDRFNPTAVEAREARQFEARAAYIGRDADGMITLSAKLDPPSAAPVIAMIDAYVKDAFRRGQESEATDPAFAETRTVQQMRADALVQIAGHGLDCDAVTTGRKSLVVLRADVKDLESGVGLAECDQLDVPISISALRRMACDAGVIPMIMGGNSAPLDMGYDSRLFSPLQRIALGERDGGCAWCQAPPSWCEAHHIRWWVRDKGPTDISNGVLLCRSCHNRIHNTGWTIRVIENRVWFVPPPDAAGDPQPRLGGRARLEEPETPVPAVLTAAAPIGSGVR